MYLNSLEGSFYQYIKMLFNICMETHIYIYNDIHLPKYMYIYNMYISTVKFFSVFDQFIVPNT